ncbi:MAG: two-component system sensor histidine kinase NtrB [Spirochaetaceae bacterium]
MDTKRDYKIESFSDIGERIGDIISAAEQGSEEDLIGKLRELHRKLPKDEKPDKRPQPATRDKLYAVLQEAPIGICITDKHGTYQYVNPAYCRLYGYGESELLGEHFTKVVHPDDGDMFIELHDRFMGRQYELSGEWKVRDSKNQEKTIFANAAYLVDTDGEPRKVTFVIDISERKKMEKNKERVERIVRHDLKNPLSGILGGVQLLMQETTDEQQQVYLTLIQDAGMQMLHMLENSFSYLQMEDGTYQAQFETFSIGELIRVVRTEVDAYAAQYGVELDFSCNGHRISETKDCLLRGEKQHLAGMLGNLIRNAIEASSRGDVVDIAFARSDELRIDIHNTGVIPEEIRDTFFDRYVSHGKRNGTGLGTYTAKLIVDYHGGDIDFRSNESEGTHLLIRLPL